MSWNTADLTCACLRALRTASEATAYAVQIIVIDNASADDSVARIQREFPDIELHCNAENRGYALGVNQGLSLAHGRYLTLLGSDTEVWGETLSTLVNYLETHPEVGVVAPRLINPDQSIQRACMRFPDLRVALVYDTFVEKKWPDNRITRHYNYQDWSHDNDAEVDQPPGTCLMVRREVVDQVGPMDGKLWLFFNDVDWCLRIRRAGWKIWYLHENTEVLHHLGQSTSRFPTFPFEWHKNRLFFYRKHFHTLGVLIVKTVMVYVAIREVLRIRRNLDKTSDFIKHASQLLRALGAVLLR